MKESRLDVILPVAGAPGDLDRCLESLSRAAGWGSAGLLLVLDGPQGQEVEEVIARHRPGLPLELLRLARRGGFTQAVNHGLRATAGDVVLLNSDTAVPAGWLERLRAAASSSPRIGTVTPLSNHATICSVPRWLVENEMPAGYDVDSFAALVERVSAREYPRLPTGVGFCLYLKRRLLDEIGTFDEAAFGRGYGEETDLCLRAAARGWEHALDDTTFVFHRGRGSYGDLMRRVRRRRMRQIERRHPGWTRRLAAYLAADPLLPVRQRIAAGLQPGAATPRGTPRRDARAVVHVVPGWPPYRRGAVELQAHGLAREQAAHRPVTVFSPLSRPDRAPGDRIELVDGGVRVSFVVTDPDGRASPGQRVIDAARVRRQFHDVLAEERPALLHVHDPPGAWSRFVALAARQGIPVVVQIYACPLNAAGPWRPHSPCPRCVQPVAPSRPFGKGGGWPILWPRLRSSLGRRRMRRTLRAASAVVVPSATLAECLRRSGALPEGVLVERAAAIDEIYARVSSGR